MQLIEYVKRSLVHMRMYTMLVSKLSWREKMLYFSRELALGVFFFFSTNLRGPYSSSGDELHTSSLRMVTEGIGSEHSVFSILTAGQEAFMAR